MIKHPDMNKLTHMFRNEVEDEELVARFKDHPEFEPEKPFSIAQYYMYFGDLWLDVVVEKLAKKHPKRIYLDNGIAQGADHGDYHWHYDQGGRLFAQSLEKVTIERASREREVPRQIEKYSRIIKCHDIPVVIQMKLGSWKSKRKGKKDVGTVRRAISLEYYQQHLHPVSQFNQGDVAYAVVSLSDIYEYRSRKKDVVAFKREKGIFLRFLMTRDDYHAHIHKMVDNYGLAVRQVK
ncbi:MAG: hypothetical protein QF632_05025 [Candidatus Woesearchaeota archaeon]|nr:hypothetical protein [Candidatus Woesearchaeota archaeon]MDP7324093.1 hypothetical protein [Candidatus Woesearchaeota archaeon]MDP7458002.1 hypothetical protein [Candidatus Woesearchaeota archaeon]